MMYGMLFVQTLLDASAMLLITFFIVEQKVRFDVKTIGWLLSFQLFCLLARTSFSVSEEGILENFAFHNFDFLPVNSVTDLIGLVFLMLIINSTFFKSNNGGFFFLTMLAIVIWILIRMISLVIFTPWLAEVSIYPISFRVMTLLLAFMLYTKVSFKLLNTFTQNTSLFTRIVLINSFFVLLFVISYVNFSVEEMVRQGVLIFIAISFVFIMSGWIVYEQRKIATQESRMEVIEQYVPVIDELVAEVRSRQHEFHNKLLAISSIVETAEDFNDAKKQIQVYTKNVILEGSRRELISIDHKVIAGFLYTKMKRADQRKIELKMAVHTTLSDLPIEDYDVIEILGILIDNALEASFGGDKILVTIEKIEDKVEIKVSNRSPYFSNQQFVQLFDKGYSTKSNSNRTRGYGLHNLKEISERYNAKIITRNHETDDIHMITIGMQL